MVATRPVPPALTRARSAAADIAWLVNAGHLERALGNLEALIHDGYPTGSGSEPVAGGTSSDPVARPALLNTATDLRYLDYRIGRRIEFVATVAAQLVDLVRRVPDAGIDTDQAWRQTRCTGGEPSTEPWVRPECQANAVTRDGLCSPCYQRRQHWRAKQAVLNTTNQLAN